MDLRSSTYTYLLADPETREAVLIDPVFEHARRLDELGAAERRHHDLASRLRERLHRPVIAFASGALAGMLKVSGRP